MGQHRQFGVVRFETLQRRSCQAEENGVFFDDDVGCSRASEIEGHFPENSTGGTPPAARTTSSNGPDDAASSSVGRMALAAIPTPT